MNKPAFISTLCIVTATQMAFAAPAITGVTAQQRYPWNGKVDISYTVSGDIAATAKQQALITELKVTATDQEEGSASERKGKRFFKEKAAKAWGVGCC